MIDVGQKAPNFSAPNNKKEMTTLDQFKGKKVVLAFFPAAFTGVCEKEMCSFRDISELNGADAQVIAVSVDAPFSNNAFAEKTKSTFPFLSDYTRAMVKAYGVELENFAGMAGYTAAKRSIFVIDREGVVRWTWVGPNQ